MPYSIKCFMEIYEDLLQILLMLKVLFIHCSEVHVKICFEVLVTALKATCSLAIIPSPGFKPVQDDFQHDFTQTADEADGSARTKIIQNSCHFSKCSLTCILAVFTPKTLSWTLSS